MSNQYLPLYHILMLGVVDRKYSYSKFSEDLVKKIKEWYHVHDFMFMLICLDISSLFGNLWAVV